MLGALAGVVKIISYILVTPLSSLDVSRERVTDAIKSIMKRLNSIQNSEKESPIIIKSDDIKVDDKTVLLNNQEEEKFDLIQGEN